MKKLFSVVVIFPLLGLFAETTPTNSLASELTRKIDDAAANVLKETGVPSASIAVVKDGKLAYTKAYGMADLAAHRAATPEMIYSIGSISKQFTAAAILMLAEEGKLSLDDPVVKWLPELTDASKITIRQILSMTSGYQDYWPQDYVMPPMLKPTSPEEIMKSWAQKPLDFEPGTKWQYSNTNYVIAGQIIAKASGTTLLDLLKECVFDKLGMTTVFDCDSAALPEGQPVRYHRYGLGPARIAPKEGKGWINAAGELAMTASDLATWSISVIDQSILKPASYADMEKATLLKNGASSQYGLGIFVGLKDGRRVLYHGGEVSGFTAQSVIYPDNHAAIVVLTNMDAAGAAGNISGKIGEFLFAPAGNAEATAQVKTILLGVQKGKIDRALLTDNANSYFDEQCLRDLAASLGPLGAPTSFVLVSENLRGGMTGRRYEAKFKNKNLGISTFTMPDGKLEQYIVAAE